MNRLSTYLVLGLLDGYYTSVIIIKDLHSINMGQIILVTMLVNLVTGLLSSYILGIHELRSIERRLLVERNYLAGTMVHRDIVVKLIINTLSWAFTSIIGSLVALVELFIKIGLTGIVGVFFSFTITAIPPLLFVYILSIIYSIKEDYPFLALISLVLTSIVYVVGVLA